MNASPRLAGAFVLASLSTGCAREGSATRGEPAPAAIEPRGTRPATGRAEPAGPVAIELPSRADRPFRVADRRSGVGAAVSVAGAAAVEGDARGREVRFAGALGADALLLARLDDGVEDSILLATARSELRWAFEPTPAVAGLRLVDGALELLDAGGAPRLRVDRPYTVDARGVRRPATLDVEGCAVDRSPRAPWGRATTPVGARCSLVVRFDGASPTYPLLVDPAWRATTSMAIARASHAAVRLGSGRVLVVGGTGGDPSSAEAFDPTTATFATLAPKSASGASAPVRLASGAWLFVGAPSTTYDEPTGSWSAKAAPTIPRLRAPTARLASGAVLVIGGLRDATTSTSSVERYDPATDAWASAAPLPDARAAHAAVVLGSGKVLVLGGRVAGASTASTSALLYDPSVDAWTAAAPLPAPSERETATLLPDGRVYLHGPQPALYDPAADAWTTTTETPAATTATAELLLASGGVLLAGGLDGAGALVATTQRFEPTTGAFAALGALSVARREAAATQLESGVLLTGGLGGASPDHPLRDAEILGDAPDGAPCAASGECLSGSYCSAGACAPKLALGAAASDPRACASGFAADGVCCDTACAGPCGACDLAASKGTCAAVRGPAKHGACAPATGGDPCTARACDGAAIASCDGYVAAEVPCREHACAAGVETMAGACDGAGACAAAVTKPCGAYVCDGKQCRTTCRSSADCEGGVTCDAVAHVCVPPVCVDERTEAGPTGIPHDCTPFRCEKGRCATRCASTDDCLAAYNCDVPSGRCVPAGGDVGPTDSGGCAATRAPLGDGLLAALALALGGLARRGLTARRRTD